MKKVAVVDYGLANIRSVMNALSCFEVEPFVADRGEDLVRAQSIVLPGVGAFDAAIRALRDRGHTAALERLVRGLGVPFLGICVGMQVLAEGSEEGREAGMGWIAGQFHRFDPSKVRVPHMGWNEVVVQGESRLLAPLKPPLDFYFLHSYYLPAGGGVPAKGGVTSYETAIASVLESDNVFAVQFHPEKSQLAGMKLLETFLSIQ